ncbi:peptide ABC transporter substrate-binding protein [Pilimelia terevasa]|uniref:Peptide ABC transporter substrate-binding protein n=1 Tax=Pilimelia terevasa TaxID=53372 RepID=A0A8J3BDU1_9ACTN|nr:ABC transporter substrate-binding protein [Pilimelia terevasa]GGK14297.1 peptide ABC transporter substrate-binding protein [Pilimelia terevasa]
MRGSTPRNVAAGLAAVAIVAAAAGCGDNKDGGSGDSAKTADGAISMHGVQPQNPLIPGMTTETGGGKIIDYMFSGLMRYPAGGGNPEKLAAESMETTDSKVYKIKLKSGMKFHDGTPVNAKSFVDAWNWAAYSPNGAPNGTFFNEIDGYKDVHGEDPDGEGPKKAPTPTAKEMKGLKVVDDLNFEVTLSAPFSIWPTKTGYAAFMPLPESFFKDTAAFGKKPVGNGPVSFVSWQDNVEVKLTRFADYSLDDKVKVKDVTVKLYQQDSAAYADLQAGNLDFMEQVPISALAGQKWKSDLPDRAIETNIPTNGIIAFPLYDKRFQNADLRKAVSLAIDRQLISDKIFFGSRPPADSWANPSTPGNPSASCSVCKYDTAEAKKLLEKAGGFSDEMVFYYNADSSHKEWMEAVANSVRDGLGIKARAEGVPTFAVFRQMIDERKMKGPYRAAWQQDYPDVENWVGPLYVTGGSSNDGDYSNKQVDALYKEGTSAKDLEGAHAKFAEALKIVDADVPSVPVYVYKSQAGFGTRLANVKVDHVGELDISAVELK